jgi:hypothetical protein
VAHKEFGPAVATICRFRALAVDHGRGLVVHARDMICALPPDAKPIAVIRDYASLIEAIRAPVAELQITHETVDHVSGIQSGYTSKLLCRPPMKPLGAISLGCVLGALGMQLIAVEDPEALERVRHRLLPRKNQGRQGRRTKRLGIVREMLARYGSAGGRAFFASRSPEEISRHQSRAARIRWRAWRRARAIRAQTSAAQPAVAPHSP